MKTYSAKPHEIERRWYIVDADGRVLGRMATEVATVLRGKHKATFTPHVDTGDFVVVVNAAKVRLTGNKLAKKLYHRHSGYPGGLTSVPYGKLLQTHPERAVERAVWGMLPKTTLGRRQIRKLKVYPGADHPHGAQRPSPLDEGLRAPAAGPWTPPERKPREPKSKQEPKSKREPAAKKAAPRKPASKKPAPDKKSAPGGKPAQPKAAEKKKKTLGKKKRKEA